jgi:hypothetical protein
MKRAISWFIAILITFSIAIFQFIMGTAYPLVTEVNTGKQHLQFELIRSYSGQSDCPIIFPVGDITVSGYILYRNYPSVDSMTRINLNREGEKLIARLPKQPPASKLEYRVFLEKARTGINVNNGKPVIIRFLGSVPLYILSIQSILIFLAVLFSNITGIFALVRIRAYKWLIYLTIITLIVVVFVLQPIMHKYSLNQWWTNIPYSWDLSDNKLFIALIVWLITMYFNFKKARPGLIVLAAFLSIIIFAVPHGFPGSEHDPIDLKIIQRNLLSLLKLF